MELLVRTERPDDFHAVKAVHSLAFGGNYEAVLVEKLRKSPDFIPELSLAAEHSRKIVGHTLFYPININDGTSLHASLALWPISVHPAYQRIGIGGELIAEGLKRARDKRFKSVIVMGYSEYYSKFGFKRASIFGIKPSFKVPEYAFLVMELTDEGLRDINGTAEYPVQFLTASMTRNRLS